jgi:hypothetical protein
MNDESVRRYLYQAGTKQPMALLGCWPCVSGSRKSLTQRNRFGTWLHAPC